jgi:Xaa-Pro aminopeptidase
MPHIPHEELQDRRSRVAEKMPEASVLVLLSAEVQFRNADIEHRFRQESSFWYLTGLNTPESALVLKKDQRGETAVRIYNQPRDPEHEIWSGRRLDEAEVSELTGVDDVRSFSVFENEWSEIFAGVRTVYFDVGGDSYPRLRERLNHTITDVSRRSGTRLIESVTRTSVILDELRLHKSEWEIQQMREAAQVSMNAHRGLASSISGAGYEHELEGTLLEQFRRADTQWSYLPIVASGENACTLHYVENSADLKSDDLLLVDAGAEYNGYAADITRVYPAAGTFSTAHKRLYEIVLKAQQTALAKARESHVSLLDLHREAVHVVSEGLVELGIHEGPVTDIIANETYKTYFPHGLGHYLGLDVHDVGPYRSLEGGRAQKELAPGMAFTVEPGLYIKADDTRAPEEFRGLGVRIEDDVVKTTEGIENLTEDLPKEPEAVEDLVSKR